VRLLISLSKASPEVTCQLVHQQYFGAARSTQVAGVQPAINWRLAHAEDLCCPGNLLFVRSGNCPEQQLLRCW